MKSELSSCYLENYNAGIIESQGKVLDALVYSRRFYNTSSSSKSYMEVRTFSSQAGAKSSGEQDDALEDAFAEIDTPHDVAQEAASGDEIDDVSMSESEFCESESVAGDIQNELETLGTETDVAEKKSPKPRFPSAMTKAVLDAPALPVSEVLDKWVEAGNEVTQTEVSLTMRYFRNRRMFVKALQVSLLILLHFQIDFV